MNRRICALLGLALFSVSCALAQGLTWVGNTKLFLTGVGAMPALGAFVEPYQTVSITTQTTPIGPNQSVTLVYSTDNWNSVQELPFTFDFNTGSNTQWYVVVGPLPKGTDIQFYVQARVRTLSNGSFQAPSRRLTFDNNGGQNFGFLSRYMPNARRGAILQWFTTDYKTIMARLPEVAQAGYGALYLPPPQKSGGGGFSVGYNPFDRFDVGSRLQLGTVGTRYGTATDLQNLIAQAHRFGIEVYCDLVMNHNDNRAGTAINRYPGLIPEDFHIHSSADTSNSEVDFNNAPPFGFGTLNYDALGLADIAQEDGNQVENGAFNLPNYAAFNSYGKPSFVRDPATASLYPNHQPVAEDGREYLLRWGWWLTTQLGFDGYRFDAVKHTPPNFFGWVQTQPGPYGSRGNLVPYLYSLNSNLFMFGECYDSDGWDQREYLKTGMNLLDFPLKFNLDSLLNSSGFGSLGNTITNGFGIDSGLGVPYELGGLATDAGVAFVQSHDQGPPQASNLGYAFTLTRPGSAIVYYDGNNQVPGDYSQFPRPGRYDALGAGTDLTLRIVDARWRFGRGNLVNRWRSDNLVLYERQVNGQGILLVGLNIRGDQTALTQTVQSAFAPGTILSDLSGQQPDVTVAANSTVTVTVPANTDASATNNARGYVLYAPKAPGAVTGIEPVTVTEGKSPLSFTTYTSPTPAHGPAGTYRAVTTTSGVIGLRIRTDAIGTSAFVKVDDGVALPGYVPLANTSEGLTDGYFAAAASGAGTFNLSSLDVTGLPDGLHIVRVRVFADTGPRPGVFKDFCAFVYLSKSGLATINGDLTKYGAPLVNQSRTPTSQSNRLDAMAVSNDDQYLYIGLAGAIDPSESFTNGLSVFLDTDPGAATGVRTFNALRDDNGPADRLLSANLTAPFGFGAEFALSSFRGSTLSSAPGAPFTGDPVSPWTVGPQAGVFRLDPLHPTWLNGVPSAIAWKPRATPFGPLSGLEAAIPLNSLYTAPIGNGGQLGLIAYAGTTGEAGTVYTSTDPNRALYGNRPPAVPYVLNQILPPQPNVTNDPGTGAVSLQQYATYSLRLAAQAPSITVNAGSITMTGNTGVQTITLTNTSSATISGPIYLIVHLNAVGATLTSATGASLREVNTAYVKLTGSMAAGGIATVNLTYQSSAGTPSPTFEVRQGPGIP